ncbi:MAG: glycosyltransferase [Gemmatimonadota bacterium]|nr:glycosyltransferase [Gemmatimonadota bacterium]
MIPVVFCVDGFEEAGTELNAVRTAEHLDRSRFDLRVVALSERGTLQARYRAAGIPIETFTLGSLVKPPPVRQARALAAYLRRERIQIFHAQGIYENVFGVPVARWAGVPTVLASRRWFKTPTQDRLGTLNRLSYRLAHGVLANSRTVGRIVAEEDRVPGDRIHVIPNFLEDEALAPPPSGWIADRKAELALPGNALVVGSVARLRPEKDLAMMITAFAQVGRQWPDAYLVLVGDGPEEQSLRALVERLDLGARVRFAGRRASRPSMHAVFDVSLLSSASEGFPNTLLEAMAMGRPVVTTAVGGAPDAIEHDANGFLVPAGDADGFAQAMSRLLADAGLRARMGAEGRRRAEAYTVPRTVGALEQLYDRMLEGRH